MELEGKIALVTGAGGGGPGSFMAVLTSVGGGNVGTFINDYVPRKIELPANWDELANRYDNLVPNHLRYLRRVSFHEWVEMAFIVQ